MRAKLGPGRQCGTLVRVPGTEHPEHDPVEWTGGHRSSPAQGIGITGVDAP
jgi:hypothetical protein